jgi:hypothetical protein
VSTALPKGVETFDLVDNVWVYSEWDAAEAAMRKLKSLGERRKAAIAMGPMLAHMDKVTRERGVVNGNDSELVHLRADKLYMLALRGFEEPCGWTQSEAWAAMSVETD